MVNLSFSITFLPESNLASGFSMETSDLLILLTILLFFALLFVFAFTQMGRKHRRIAQALVELHGRDSMLFIHNWAQYRGIRSRGVFQSQGHLVVLALTTEELHIKNHLDSEAPSLFWGRKKGKYMQSWFDWRIPYARIDGIATAWGLEGVTESPALFDRWETSGAGAFQFTGTFPFFQRNREGLLIISYLNEQGERDEMALLSSRLPEAIAVLEKQTGLALEKRE